MVPKSHKCLVFVDIHHAPVTGHSHLNKFCRNIFPGDFGYAFRCDAGHSVPLTGKITVGNSIYP